MTRPPPIAQAFPSSNATLPWRIGVWMLCLTGWLLADVYLGIRHDGLLYLGQALNRLNPAFYSHDLFLSLSGQDRFTIATTLMGKLYGLTNIGAANLVVIAGTQVALAAAIWFWLRPLGWVAASAGLMAFAVTTHAYGPTYVFHAGERFATARSFAEPTVLAAMLAVLHGRVRWGLALMILSSLLHPLMTAPAWAWWWMLRLPQDRKLWAIPAVALCALLLGAFGVPGLAALAQRYDDVWWDVVERRNLVLVGSYGLEGLVDVGAVGLLVLVSRWTHSRPLSDGLRALSTIAFLLAGVTAWGADIFRFTLPTQLQLLRIMWLVQLLAIATLPWLLWQAWCRRGIHGQIWALVVAATATAANARLETLWLYLLSVGLACALLYKAPAMRKRLSASLLLAATLLLLLACAGSWSQFVFSSRLYAPFAPHLDILALMATPPVGVAIIGILHHARGARLVQLTSGAWLPLLALAAVFYAASKWDQRSLFIKAVESAGADAAHPWQALVPLDEPVYWLNGEPAVWTLLRRPIFGSTAQGAAALFNRELALRYDERMVRLHSLHEAAQQCHYKYTFMGMQDFLTCEPTGETLEALCGQLPGFRFFVTANEASKRTAVATWRPPGKGPGRADYTLHDCAKLAGSSSTPRPVPLGVQPP